MGLNPLLIRFKFALAVALIAAPAFADPALSPAQVAAFSQLAAGYAGGVDCNLEIDVAVATSFIRQRFGDATYSAEQVALTAFMVAGTEAMHKSVSVDCKVIARAFGPHGSTIPGLLK